MNYNSVYKTTITSPQNILPYSELFWDTSTGLLQYLLMIHYFRFKKIRSSNIMELTYLLSSIIFTSWWLYLCFYFLFLVSNHHILTLISLIFLGVWKFFVLFLFLTITPKYTTKNSVQYKLFITAQNRCIKW